jgi:hypothetical protein
MRGPARQAQPQGRSARRQLHAPIRYFGAIGIDLGLQLFEHRLEHRRCSSSPIRRACLSVNPGML